MSRKTNLDKFQELMFRDISEITDLDHVERQQLIRYRFAFTQLLDNPSKEDTILRDDLMNEFGISQSQAYRDISNMKVILPNIRNAGKEWIRYIVNEELKAAIKFARDNAKPKEWIAAISALAKYNKLDQDEAEAMPWDEIIPTPIEPTSDPRVLGIEPLKDEAATIKKLLEKYKGDIEIEDIEYEDFSDEHAKEKDIFQ
jgi:hypothetical protein